MITRRGFVKTGLMSSAAFGWTGVQYAGSEEKVQKIPLKGAMFERRNGELVLMGRGLVWSSSTDQGRTWSEPKPLTNRGKPVVSHSHVLGLRRLQSGKVA